MAVPIPMTGIIAINSKITESVLAGYTKMNDIHLSQLTWYNLSKITGAPQDRGERTTTHQPPFNLSLFPLFRDRLEEGRLTSRYQTICLLGAFFPAAPAAFTPAVAPNPNPDPDPKVELVVELPIPPVPADPAVPTPPEFGPATPLGFGFECPGV